MPRCLKCIGGGDEYFIDSQMERLSCLMRRFRVS